MIKLSFVHADKRPQSSSHGLSNRSDDVTLLDGFSHLLIANNIRQVSIKTSLLWNQMADSDKKIMQLDYKYKVFPDKSSFSVNPFTL